MTDTPVTPPPAHDADDEGAIGRFLHRLLGKSWKTSITGIISVICAVIPLVPGVPPEWTHVAQLAGPIILGGGIMLAKDHNVSGTNRP